MRQLQTHRNRRGIAAVLAMMFLVLATTLTLAMYTLATTNVQSAYNLADVSRAQGAAEAGLRWSAYRFAHMTRPSTTVGNITPAVADTLWPGIKTAVQNNLALMTKSSEQTYTADATSITCASISTETNGPTFRVRIEQNPADKTYLIVTSTGTYRNATRTASMQFKIDKKVKYAVVGKVPIQLGRNTIVEGPVAMATANKYPPILMLSDFMHFDTTLANQLTVWNTWLQAHHNGYDNRISVNNSTEYNAACSAGYADVNGDAYIDEYDLFLKRFDSNNDKAISTQEFTNPGTGQLYEANLFKAIDTINAPMFAGDTPRVGYNDGMIDNSDGYAKLRGYIQLATSASAWSTNLAGSGQDINDMIQGTVAPTEPGQVPVTFSVPSTDMIDLNPANFEQAAQNFKSKTGTAAGATALSGTATYAKIENKVLTGTDNQVMQVTTAGSTGFQVGDKIPKAKYDAINAALPSAQRATGTNITPAIVTEQTPYGSTSWQAKYKRPVFKNMHLKNVQIPKGMNPLFDNCTFEGVTWVETEHDITTTGGSVTTDPSQGKTWAQTKLTGSGNFSNNSVLISSGTPASGEMVTKGSQNGNNLRFNNCAFNGPLAGNYATAYTHFANSWEFTGSTMFDNQVDQTATIVSPQVNIEMGSFTNPGLAPSTLVGVVVVGNIDIRGTSNVDGSIIVTGDGAGNTTLAYFGASDASTDPNAPMPEGGWGRLNIRYNPSRALPDGINIPIDILPSVSTYSEGVTCPS